MGERRWTESAGATLILLNSRSATTSAAAGGHGSDGQQSPRHRGATVVNYNRIIV